MRRGSFGLVVLVVVMTIALLLVARAWKQVEPQARGVSGADATLAPGELPGLEELHKQTDAHTEAVDEAIVVIED
jgi:hypothetical protein